MVTPLANWPTASKMRAGRQQESDLGIGVEPYLKGVNAGFTSYRAPPDLGPPRPLTGRLLSEHNLQHLDNSDKGVEVDIAESISRLEIDLTNDEDASTDGSEDFVEVERSPITESKSHVQIFQGGNWTTALPNGPTRPRNVSNASSDGTIQGIKVAHDGAWLDRERSILGDDAFARKRRDINRAMGPSARGPLHTADIDNDSVWGGLQDARPSTPTPGQDVWELIDNEMDSPAPRSVVDLNADISTYANVKQRIQSFMAPPMVKPKVNHNKSKVRKHSTCTPLEEAVTVLIESRLRP